MSRKSLRIHAPRLAREQRVDEILGAARAVFSEKGFEAAAVAEIAARIGVVEGTIYKYFATKHELLLKVLEYWYEEMFGDYARDLAGVAGARARLHLLVWRHLRSIRDYPLLCRLMFREVHGEADYHGSGLHEMNRQYTQLLVQVLDEGRSSGEFRRDLPATLLRDLIYGATQHHCWNYVCGRGALDIDTLAQQLVSIVCDGIAQPNSSASLRAVAARRAGHEVRARSKRVRLADSLTPSPLPVGERRKAGVSK